MPKSVAAIIPAYNEEKTIGNVLKPLSAMEIIDEIIVISDGSYDNTASIARDYNARVIELEKNQGKSNAVLKGVNVTDAEVIIMLDADLIGLTENHVLSLVEPVLKNGVDMTIGIFKHGRGATDFAQKIAPFLSGQRVITRKVIDKLLKYKVKDYGIEMALTLMADREKINVKEIYLEDLTHVMKEEKRGLFFGFLISSKDVLGYSFLCN